MSKYVIEDTTLTAIADAVRTKGGTTDPIVVSEIPTAIANLPSGGGEGLTAEDLAFKGSLSSHTLSGNLGTKIVDRWGNLITFTDVSKGEYLFNENTADLSGLTINVKNLDLSMFFRGYSGTQLPKLAGTIATNAYYAQYMFSDLSNVREIPSSFYEGIDWSSNYIGGYYAFAGCRSLRSVPKDWLNSIKFSKNSYIYAGYQGVFYNCYTLDELTDYTVNNEPTVTDNMMNNFCSWNSRMKDLTFKTNDDGTPIEAQWKNQTLELYQHLGWSSGTSNILNYNSGITADKQVTDDATYQALKDDPDWFTTNVAYSRYNHDSAVRTINSLPDTSAYLATAGGTNTIKFKGAAGELTDGGAINTLTEEEIAVATAKGWTVTLV